MKVRVSDIRRLIREEFLSGVPEWRLRQDTADFVDAIRDRIKDYVLVNKSGTSIDRAEALAAMNLVCDELEEKVYAVLENELFAFLRHV